MEASSSASNQKRHHENGYSPPSPQRKSQRLIAESQSPRIASDEPMKIIDLNHDCLKKIFGYLDQRSLFNVAVANEWLRPVGGVVYERKIGTMKVCIKNSGNYPLGSNLYITDNWIYVTGFKLCLQYLRCLGQTIGNLSIWYGKWNEKQCKLIHQYINEYCVGSLVDIQFYDKSKFISIKGFEKSFVNVRAVEVFDSDLRSQLSSFAEWFPNMRSLKLDGVGILRCIDAPIFHRLEDLSINIAFGECSLTVIQATRLLQQLPQLHSLSVDIDGRTTTLNKLLNMIKNNRNICKLKVNMVQDALALSPMAESDIQQLVNEHPLLTELELVGFELRSHRVMSLIRQLNLLKKFGFQIVNGLEYRRLVSRLDRQWRSSFYNYNYEHLLYIPCYIELER